MMKERMKVDGGRKRNWLAHTSETQKTLYAPVACLLVIRLCALCFVHLSSYLSCSLRLVQISAQRQATIISQAASERQLRASI